MMKPPKFVQPLKDTTIEAESQDLQLICRVESGSEKVDLIWFLNEQNITDYSIFDESSGYCTLKMEKGDSTSKNLSGTYVCKAVTLGGEDVTKSVVAIRKSPTNPAFYVPLKNKVNSWVPNIHLLVRSKRLSLILVSKKWKQVCLKLHNSKVV